MRLKIKMISEKFMPQSKVNRHTIQGAIYALLDNTEFSDLHSKQGFKFFTYSNVFPIGDYYPRKEKTLILSSPNEKLIDTLQKRLEEVKYIYFSDTPLRVVETKKYSLKFNGKLITGTPIVLMKDGENGIYLSFNRGDSIRFFMDRLKENALKKYNEFYGENLEMKEDIFDMLVFQKEVSVVVKKDGKSFIIIGSLWSMLEKRVPKGYGKFYSFIMDCGLGEKNSLGFGFVNPLRKS